MSFLSRAPNHSKLNISMENPGSQKEIGQFMELADKLDGLQKNKNSGRGVSCVQTLVIYLRKGDAQSAKAVCWNEADKIVNYPDIRRILQKELFLGDDDKDIPPHFKASSDKLYDKQ